MQNAEHDSVYEFLDIMKHENSSIRPKQNLNYVNGMISLQEKSKILSQNDQENETIGSMH